MISVRKGECNVLQSTDLGSLVWPRPAHGLKCPNQRPKVKSYQLPEKGAKVGMGSPGIVALLRSEIGESRACRPRPLISKIVRLGGVKGRVRPMSIISNV